MVPSFEKRVRAFAIDTSGVALVSMIAIFGIAPQNQRLAQIVMLIGAFSFYLLPYFFSEGQTLGKRVQKIKIVKSDDTKASLLRIILREITKLFLSAITGGLYLIVATFSMNSHVSRTIHDYIFQTKMIDLEPRSKRSDLLGKSSLLKDRGL
jgi:uncharacterized RDD family membrane protein YckC